MKRLIFTRTTLCIARSLLSCGVCQSVRLSHVGIVSIRTNELYSPMKRHWQVTSRPTGIGPSKLATNKNVYINGYI